MIVTVIQPKEGIIAAKKEKGETKGSSIDLKPNIERLLCYVGFWVTGIIFLIIEKKNKLVRFQAMQSLVTFGILHIILGIANSFRGLGLLRGLGGFWGPQYIAATVIYVVFFVLWWVLWAVGMYKAYHGTPFRIPIFTNLAEKCLATLDAEK